MSTLVRQPRYQQIAEDLRLQVRRGELSVGTRLPSFPEMKRQGVSQNTMEKVYSLLESDGLIERSTGSGVYVAPAKKRNRTGVIGLACLDSAQPQHFGMHFYGAQVQEGVRAAAKAHGLHLMLLDSDADEAALRRLDGVLVAPNTRPPMADAPCVLLDHRHPHMPSVDADDSTGISEAIEHLASLGHRRIAYLISGHEPYHTPRLRAYQSALLENQIEPNPRWVRHIHEVGKNPTTFVGAAGTRMRQWLREDWEQLGCTALLCQNDQAALGVLEVFRETSLKVPQDVSVIGFDGTEAAEYAHPRLTTIEVPLHEIGACGVELLLRLIDGAQDASTRVLPTKLRIDDSTAPVGRKNSNTGARSR